MQRPLQPLEIEKKDAGTLRILWDDGHESLLRFARLRSECPCASCNTRPRQPPALQLVGTGAPRGLEAVGNYAIQITWSDGHASGIYSWEALRRLCECEACRERSRREKP
jgi:DUF971 family protein